MKQKMNNAKNTMPVKRYWRCTICGDLHYGVKAPEICPTCSFSREKAVEITRAEFLALLKVKNNKA